MKSELKTYRLVLEHPRTPKRAKWLLGFALAYVASPIDLIPDFIPVLGQLDDWAVAVFLVRSALKMIPPGVFEECRAKACAIETGGS